MKKPLLILVMLALPLPAAAASPSPSPSVTPASTALPVPVPAGGELRINEFLPNPAGTDTGNEWVELKNVSAKTLDVGGAKVKRQTGTTVATVPADTLLAPGGLFLATASGSMVNGGDTLELWVDTAKIDQVTYGTAEDGLSWVRLGAAEGAWSDRPTPGEENPADVSAGAGDEDDASAADPTSASTRGASAGSGTVARRTAGAAVKRGPLPRSGIGGWAYVLPVLLATLYAYRTRHDH